MATDDDDDGHVRGNLISFAAERSVPEGSSVDAKQRRPKKKPRASQFDDDEDLYDGGELLFGFHLPPVKTETQFVMDTNEAELLPANQLQVVPNADKVSWHPTVEWRESLKESCDLFNSKIEMKGALEDVNFDMILKEIQSDPTFDHYMDKFSAVWKSINKLSDEQVHDDILLMDTANIYKAEKQLEKTHRFLKVLKSLRKDRARARDNALEDLKKEGFEYKYEKKKRILRDTPKVASALLDDIAKASTSNLIVIEEQYESDSDRDDNLRDDMSSGGSVIDEDFDVSVAPQIEKNDEMVTNVAPEQAATVPEVAPTPLPCYNNISGAIIKRRVDGEPKNIFGATNKSKEVMDHTTSKPVQIEDKLNHSEQEPVRNLKRKASEELGNEDAKRKLERDGAGNIIHPAGIKRGMSSDDWSIILKRSHDDSNIHKYLDDDIICIDEDSDPSLVTRDDTFDGYIWRTNLNRIWKMPRLSQDILPRSTYAERLLAYNLPPLEKPRPGVQVAPPRFLPPIKRKDNGDRCSIYLDLGLKNRNIREVAVYEKLRSGLSIEEQLACNNEKELTQIEREYTAKHIIPQFGSVPYLNFKFPTEDAYEGFYWPIFQPIDDISISGADTIYNADVQNQIVNQTICNYAAKRKLLCDGSDDGIGFWSSSYKQGCDVYESVHRKKSGRFTNRVCFARNLPSKEVESRNLRAKEINRADDEKYRRDIEKQREEQKQQFLAKYGKTESEAEAITGTFLAREYGEALWSTTLSTHVRESQRDAYSLVVDRGNRKYSRYPTDWFEVPFDEYIPANDRRTFLCIYINHYNTPIVRSMPRPRNLDVTSERYIEAIVPWIAGAFTAAFAFQFDKERKFNKVSANGKPSHSELSKRRLDTLEKNFSRGATINLRDLEALCRMEEWEWEYWPLIWDSLSSIYRKLPPLSHLMKFIYDAVDTAFRDIAKLPHRKKYFCKYTERKNSYLQA